MEDSLVEVCPTTCQGTIPDDEMPTSDTDPSALNELKFSDMRVSASEPRNYDAVEDALSIFPVLRNIFWLLDDEDLRICRQVSKNWKTVADLMMSTRYDVLLAKIDRSGENPDPMKNDFTLVKKWDRCNRQSVMEFKTNFEGVAKMLEDDLQSPKITVRLTIENNVDVRNGRGKHFLSKFGHFVVALDFTGRASLSLNNLRKLLLENLPNLKMLNLSGEINLEGNSPEDQSLSPNLAQSMKTKLTKISFCRWTSMTVGSMETLLEMSPKLERIEQMPLYLIEAVRRALKGHVLKSLTNTRVYYGEYHQDKKTGIKALKKLADLQPKLTSFLLPDMYSTDCESTTMEFRTMKSSVIFSILKSSCESLESLSLTLTECCGFQTIPTMTRLKSLELSDPYYKGYELGNLEFFPRDVTLQEVFPNVSDLYLEFEYMWPEHYMKRYLPADVFSPWGLQIRLLKLKTLESNIPPVLQSLFPNIQELHLTESTHKMAINLKALPHLWPGIKSLTIAVDWRPLVLDWTFLGLSKDIVKQVLDPKKTANFTVAEIQGFKERCNICKLKGLKELRIVLHCCVVQANHLPGQVFRPLTPVITNEFGFKLLEDLIVTVEIQRHQQYFKVIKKELEKLAGSGNIKIVESCDFDRSICYRED